jgi:hypothetical protein
MAKEGSAVAAAEMQQQQLHQHMIVYDIEELATVNSVHDLDHLAIRSAEMADVENALSADWSFSDLLMTPAAGQQYSFELVETAAVDAVDANRNESTDYMVNTNDFLDVTQSLEYTNEPTLNLLDERLFTDMLNDIDVRSQTKNDDIQETEEALLAAILAATETNGEEDNSAEVSANLTPYLLDPTGSALSSPGACQSLIYDCLDSDSSSSSAITNRKRATKRKADEDDDFSDENTDSHSGKQVVTCKKEANKAAALRYRNKKQRERELLFVECDDYEKRNASLRKQIDDVQSEIDCIKSLLVQVLVSKNASSLATV